MNKRLLETALQTIMSQPTAPFHEYHVRNAIHKSLLGIKGVHLMEDPFGNLVVHYKKGRSKPRWALGAHMDHPGWVRNRLGNPEFLGGVPEATRAANLDRIEWFGPFGMWSLPAFERWNGTVASRACDDLAGCVLIVATLLDLAHREVPANFYALFTRAEEVGFLGMHHMLSDGAFPPDVSYLCIETSALVDGARQGAGPVIRVGDRLSVFDAQATATLEAVAKASQIPFQRLLLDRGACEASLVVSHGIPSAGLSILLENYHNCGSGTAIAAEKIHFDDMVNSVRLLTALLSSPTPPDPAAQLRNRIVELNKKHGAHARDAQSHWPH